MCLGNICRSPLGELLLAARLPVTEFEVSSAGVMALVGQPMDADASVHAAAEGIDFSEFRAQQLTDAHVADSDLVLTATKELRSRVLSESPGALRRTFAVLEFADLLDHVSEPASRRDLVAKAAAARSLSRLESHDIPDPYRRGEQAHRDSADLMRGAVDRIAKGLTSVS